MQQLSKYVMMEPFEILIVIGIIGILTYVATVQNEIQYQTLMNPIAAVCIILLGLIAFLCSPAAGLVVFLLIAVLFYKRNEYGVLRSLIPKQQVALPYNAKSGDDLTTPNGQYDIEESRPHTNDSITKVFTYKPGEEVSGNEFVRYGPNIDEKTKLVRY